MVMDAQLCHKSLGALTALILGTMYLYTYSWSLLPLQYFTS